MTKLTKQDLPSKDTSMHFCKICKEWVPHKDKHNEKRHK